MKKISHYFDAFWLAVATGFIAITVITVLSQVVTRYILGTPLPWTEEVSRLSLVCAVYAGTVPAYVRSEHILVDFFIRTLPRFLIAPYVLVLKLVSVFVIGYIAWGAYLQTHATRNMMLIALPSVSIAVVYAIQLLALSSLVLVILLTWRDVAIYLPAPLKDEPAKPLAS